MGENITCISSDGTATRFVLEVTKEADHWVSVLAHLDAYGEPETTRVAPKFYGTTAEQARRRMIAVLENQYEEVRGD